MIYTFVLYYLSLSTWYFINFQNGINIKSRGNSYNITTNKTSGQKYFAAITVITDIFINHLAKDQAILSSSLFFQKLKQNRQNICIINDMPNNHKTIIINLLKSTDKNRLALYETGHNIINPINNIETQSIWGYIYTNFSDKYFLVRYDAIIGKIQNKIKSINIENQSIFILFHSIYLLIIGNNMGVEIVVIIANIKAINEFHFIKRVNDTAAIHAGAIANKNTHVAKFHDNGNKL